MPAASALRIAFALLLLTASGVARGDPFESADTQAARRHYLTGRDLYEQGQYEQACTEFATARKILTLPALDYNLAKCEERLEHWSRAIDLYQRYLGEVGPEADKQPVRTRVLELQERIAALAPLPPPPPQHGRGVRIAAISLAAGAVVLGAVGTGAYLSEWSTYENRRTACAGACSPASLTGLTHGVDRARDAGYALWGLAGALAISDVVLWVVDARRRGERPARVSLASGVTF